MQNIKIQIKNVTPLIQHRFEFRSQDESSKRASGMATPTAENEAETAAYKNAKGFYEPSSHIEGSMLKAASNFKIPGRGKKTYKDLLKSALLIDPVEIPLKPQEYEIFSTPVVVQRSRIVRSRPKFVDWSLEFTINITDEQLRPDVVKEILEFAGRNVGIGDWRPKYGRFSVEKFEVIKE